VSQHDPEGDPTTPHARASKGSGIVSGEARPPDEHTRRVEAFKRQQEQQTKVKVHEDAPIEVVQVPVATLGGSSPAEMDRLRKQKRRERDRRAERMALGAVLLVFISIGTGGYFLTRDMKDEVPVPPTPDEIAQARTKALEKKAALQKAHTSKLVETSDLPALRMMSTRGLTVAAEGLPEVSANVQSSEAGVLAAIETCRFAYGVWEFSPNKRFRFLTTCEAKEGQVLVGAYQVSGTTVTLSTLIDGPGQLTSTFELEKPSRMITHAIYGGILLEVNQSITTLREGMEGEAFRATFEPRNTLNPPGAKPKKESLFDALQQQQQQPAQQPIAE
jgi:hypothetical protein